MAFSKQRAVCCLALTGAVIWMVVEQITTGPQMADAAATAAESPTVGTGGKVAALETKAASHKRGSIVRTISEAAADLPSTAVVDVFNAPEWLEPLPKATAFIPVAPVTPAAPAKAKTTPPKVTAVMRNGGGSIAVVGSKFLRVGDCTGGYKLTEVGRNGATFTDPQGGTVVVNLTK